MRSQITFGSLHRGPFRTEEPSVLRFHSPFDRKRLIGDKKKMAFHDSLYESMPGKIGGCEIDRIPREDVVIFDP
jgi:hypothetical protein